MCPVIVIEIHVAITQNRKQTSSLHVNGVLDVKPCETMDTRCSKPNVHGNMSWLIAYVLGDVFNVLCASLIYLHVYVLTNWQMLYKDPYGIEKQTTTFVNQPALYKPKQL